MTHHRNSASQKPDGEREERDGDSPPHCVAVVGNTTLLRKRKHSNNHRNSTCMCGRLNGEEKDIISHRNDIYDCGRLRGEEKNTIIHRNVVSNCGELNGTEKVTTSHRNVACDCGKLRGERKDTRSHRNTGATLVAMAKTPYRRESHQEPPQHLCDTVCGGEVKE